ncbi:hypothetical protein LQZ19_08745 [Treponema primitia]|uniref:hypothetical protein n=1 Tax=Treponema primitia TaxID=88058 RepID=UPI00397F1AF7
MLNPKGTIKLKIEGREVKTMQGRFAYGIDLFASLWNAEIAWFPGKDSALDKSTARGSFADSELSLGGELVGTGCLYTRENIITANGITKQLEFYSKTADLVDSCLFPALSEIRDSDLKQIAEKVLADNDIPVKFIDPPGAPFEVIERQGVETVAKYFQRLAAQRGLFISTDPTGTLIFQKAIQSGKPVAHLEWGGKTATEYRAKFDDRTRYAKYIAGSQAGDGEPIYATAYDPKVPKVRQLLFDANEADAGNIQDAAEWRMLKLALEAYSIPFPVSDWYDDSGHLWKPNTIVTAKSPVLDIPDTKQFIIRQAEFAWSATGCSAVLSLVPPLTVDGSGNLKVGM